MRVLNTRLIGRQAALRSAHDGCSNLTVSDARLSLAQPSSGSTAISIEGGRGLSIDNCRVHSDVELSQISDVRLSKLNHIGGSVVTEGCSFIHGGPGGDSGNGW